MIPIQIDISDVIQEFNLMIEESANLKNTIVDSIVSEYVSKWEDLVNSKLSSTRNEYKKAIFVNKENDGSAIIGLTPRQSSLALMIEDGASSFDMKEGFEKSDKKKFKKDGGWYLTVPFRHATSESLGESSVFSGKLPPKIEQVAKKLNGASISFSDLPSEFQVDKTSLPVNIRGYQHKTSIYQGIKRVEIGAPGEKRGGYMSFRRVSDNSDDDSWIHKGFKGEKFMESAFSSLEGRMDIIVDIAIDNFLGSR